MADEFNVGFDQLVTYRQQLRAFCSLHYNSLIGFEQGKSCKLYESEILDDAEAHNLTSSATCIASLLGCPEALLPPKIIDLTALARGFSVSALQRPQERWLSEKSARIYSRCRT